MSNEEPRGDPAKVARALLLPLLLLLFPAPDVALEAVARAVALVAAAAADTADRFLPDFGVAMVVCSSRFCFFPANWYCCPLLSLAFWPRC